MNSFFDGLMLEIAIFEPDGMVNGIVQFSHGMVEHKEYYYDFMEYLCKEGYVCIINDHRGHGNSIKSEDDYGYFYEESSDAIVEDLHQVTKYVKAQAEPEYEDSYYEFLTNMNGTTVMSGGASNADAMDSLYDEVVEFVKAQQKASTSLLQRRFGIGYNRAARLIDTLEDRGIIGPANGAKPREVYLKDDE